MRGKHRNQSGNIIVAIFAAIAAVGVLGVVTMNTIQGPVRTMSEVTQRTIADNDMIAATILISETSLAAANADCDADGVIEPIPFQDAGVYSAPAGGGIIPMNIGAKRTDPWGNPYGYCVWDDGAVVYDDACGGPDANRLAGGNTTTAPVIAIISSGPDRVFQTTCSDYIDEDTHTVARAPNSDDMMHVIPYGQFLLPSQARAQLENLPEEACHGETIGTLRLQDGSVQVCTDVGWTEVGTSAFADSNFEPITNAILNHEYTTPNVLTFQGFLNRRDVAVTEGAAMLVINGTPAGTQTTIAAGDTIALRAMSPPVPETTYTFAISVGGVRKVWTIRTRDFTPASLTITPETQAMTINAPGTPGYGDVYPFIVRNVGEVESGNLLTSQLSNTTNFEFYDAGSYHGDECAGANLGADEFCIIDIRPRANDDGAYTGTLVAQTSAASVEAQLSINATGWSCPIPWGGTIPHNGEVTAWQSATAPWNGSCQSQTRTCTLGTLSGSHTHQSCSVTPTTYAYGAWSGWGGCSATCGGGTQTRNRTCIRQNDGASVDCSHCGGVCSQSQACNTQTCCVRQPATGWNYAFTSGQPFYVWHVWYENHPQRGISWNGYANITNGYLGSHTTSFTAGGWTYLRGPLVSGVVNGNYSQYQIARQQGSCP